MILSFTVSDSACLASSARLVFRLRLVWQVQPLSASAWSVRSAGNFPNSGSHPDHQLMLSIHVFLIRIFIWIRLYVFEFDGELFLSSWELSRENDEGQWRHKRCWFSQYLNSQLCSRSQNWPARPQSLIKARRFRVLLNTIVFVWISRCPLLRTESGLPSKSPNTIESC